MRAPVSPRPPASDETVTATNDHATQSKVSAVRLGYYEDEFVSLFCKSSRRVSPLMHRGYYSRVLAMRRVLLQFLEDVGTKAAQVINLGAGYDTSYFHMRKEGRWGLNVRLFEVDVEEVAIRKSVVIQAHPAEFAFLGDLRFRTMKALIESPTYCLLGQDLRNVEELGAVLHALGVDRNLPTLFMSECVLIYLEPNDSDRLISWTATFKDVRFVSYEQICPGDSFGQIMVRNLKARGAPLLGIFAYPTAAAHRERYGRAGYEGTRTWDMNELSALLLHGEELRRYDANPVTNDFIPGYGWCGLKGRCRIGRLEMLDEVEELALMQAHYITAVAYHGCAFDPFPRRS